jgi:Fur family transcriptional regulator, ferric uptake regulator
MLVATNCSNKELHMSCGPRLMGELRAAGYRVTPQRLVILESVAHAHDHTSAQQVFKQARQRLPGLNPATVYRTLQRLRDAGLVDLHTNGGQALRFSLRDAAHPHAHLVCRACGRELELDPEAIAPLRQTVRRRTGFHIDAQHLTLTGLCSRCSTDHP